MSPLLPIKSLDASGGSAFLNLRDAAEGVLIRAAASTQTFGVISIQTMPPRKPSQEAQDEWLFSGRKKRFPYPDHTERSGKWLVFLRPSEADDLWLKIKDAVERGQLGSEAKVSTNSPHSVRFNPNVQVICVYTYDYDDRADVMRVRDRLRELGVTWPISYKADEDTADSKYRATGHRNISKYRE